MALMLKTDPDFAKAFNRAIGKSDLKAICSKILMPKAQWESIMEKCTRNRFFLCAEEVRAYTDAIQAVRSRLESEQRSRFERTGECRL